MLSDVEVYTLTQRVHNCIVYYSLQEFQIQKMEDTDCERWAYGKAGNGNETDSGALRHGTCHFYTIYTGISKISTVYGNLKDQMKLDLCICEALSYTLVPWKPQLWAWLSITTNIN